MTSNKRFAKQVYIRHADDGTGFIYTVKYGWLSLPGRRVRVFEEAGNPELEMPVNRKSESSSSSDYPDHCTTRDLFSGPAPRRPVDRSK